VADLANPHHTTIHYNGWRGDNPEGFPTDRRTYFRFESGFVGRVGGRLAGAVAVADAARGDLDYARAIWDLVVESNGLVRTLYRIDKSGAFVEGRERSEAGQVGYTFAERRIERGATLLRDLWTTACRRGALRAEAVRLRDAIREGLAEVGVDLWVEVDLERNVDLYGRLESPAAWARAKEVVAGFDAARRIVSHVRVLY